jgi:hypothetical protein
MHERVMRLRGVVENILATQSGRGRFPSVSEQRARGMPIEHHASPARRNQCEDGEQDRIGPNNLSRCCKGIDVVGIRLLWGFGTGAGLRVTCQGSISVLCNLQS